jgi:hypothetical protein
MLLSGWWLTNLYVVLILICCRSKIKVPLAGWLKSSRTSQSPVRAPLAGLRLWLKRLRLWLWQNNSFFGEAEAIL